ncbi:MAG: WecB/TagA/CpsF family glycosyltransferase [Flavobacteriales bacterium]
MPSVEHTSLLGHRVDILTRDQFTDVISECVKDTANGYVSFVNAHMMVEAHENPRFALVLEGSMLNLCDGMSIVRTLRWRGVRAHRLAGPDMMPLLCALAEKQGWSIGLFGGSEPEISKLQIELQKRFVNLRIGIALAPAFMKTGQAPDQNHIGQINQSGVDLLFVSLGCPKQEWWMHQSQEHLNCLQFGVGAAFPLLAGIQKRAPKWMQQLGLEWLFRLAQEPKRLWKRYTITNLRFLSLLIQNR